MGKLKVLCAGNDEPRERAHSFALQRAGFSTAVATGRDATIVAASDTEFDVAILSPSLSALEAQRLGHDLAVVSPETLIVDLTRETVALDGGAADPLLVKLVRAALQRRCRHAHRAVAEQSA